MIRKHRKKTRLILSVLWVFSRLLMFSLLNWLKPCSFRCNTENSSAFSSTTIKLKKKLFKNHHWFFHDNLLCAGYKWKRFLKENLKVVRVQKLKTTCKINSQLMSALYTTGLRVIRSIWMNGTNIRDPFSWKGITSRHSLT